jgi:hypothetical protein
MELPGHSQIGITMNIYSHVMPGQLTAAARRDRHRVVGTDHESDDGDDGTPGPHASAE